MKRKLLSPLILFLGFSSLAYCSFDELNKGYFQEGSSHSEKLEPLLHGYIHDDGTFCSEASGETLYYIYDTSKNTFKILDIETFVAPADFAPLNSQEEIDKAEKAFKEAHPQEEYKDIKVMDIAIELKEPNLRYLIIMKPLKQDHKE